MLLCNHDQGYKMDPVRYSSWCRVAHPALVGEGGAEEDVVVEEEDLVEEVEEGRRRGARQRVPRQLWLLGQGERVNAALQAAAPRAVRGRIAFAEKVAVRDHVRRLRACHLALDTAAIG